MINELFFSELNRALVAVPPGVYHAVEAVGQIDSLLFNIPNQPYNYKDPDKYTVPLENDFIPYSFGLVKGF
jgi:dTDP-4-dehydrorhamnose 3,5-epimerase